MATKATGLPRGVTTRFGTREYVTGEGERQLGAVQPSLQDTVEYEAHVWAGGNLQYWNLFPNRLAAIQALVDRWDKPQLVPLSAGSFGNGPLYRVTWRAREIGYVIRQTPDSWVWALKDRTGSGVADTSAEAIQMVAQHWEEKP